MWQLKFAGFFDVVCITKCGKVILLQSVTDCYHKVRQALESVTDCYYKVRQVLQSLTVFTKWDATRQSFLYLHDTEYKNSKNENGLRNNINNL